jgi:transposase
MTRPLFEGQELPMLRILTDRDSKYRGKMGNHDDELYLAINDIEHSKKRRSNTRKTMASASVSTK